MALPRVPGYRLVRLAGRGGFGSVYEARRAGDSRRVAMKIAHRKDPYAVRRIRYEALALREVGPPVVPDLLEDGTSSESVYLAMEWITAPTLAVRLAELGGPMSIAEFAVLAPAIARAIARLHAGGFVHRDLKPDHIVLDRDTRGRIDVRLLDLGLVVPIDAPEPHRVRRKGAIIGTTGYMAPEQIAAQPITPKADIYALGVIMYEMLAGSGPFAGSSTELQAAHLLKPAPRVGAWGAVPAPLERVVERCLRKRPQRRYATMTSLRSALTRALRKVGV